MKKRLLSLLLALCLLTGPALAVNPGEHGFVRQKAYAGQFSDLPAGSTFYANVSALYEYGLSVGNADGTFGVSAPLSVGQALIFAGRIRSLYRTGDPEAGAALHKAAGLPTAMPYLLYLRAEGIPLDTALEARLPHPATRAEMAHILANLLPESVLPDIHHDLVTESYATRRAITDVTEYTPYQQDILALYRKGVSIGSDEKGTFYPNSSITRGAAAAMLTRMIDPALRVTPQWQEFIVPEPAALTLAQLVPAEPYIATPATEEDLLSSVRYMLSTGNSRLSLLCPGFSEAQVQDLMSLTLAMVKSYCEQGYNAVTCTYSSTGSLLLEFSANGAGAHLQEYRRAAMKAALAVREELWRSGRLRKGMTEQEMAEVYYTWVCEHCTYDHSADDTSLSHLAYSLFEHGLAVCDGYTGAYNLLLKLEGIACTAVYNDTHIWTAAVLDGVEYHIDTTWGDAGDTPSYIYFAMTPEQSLLYHSAAA